MGNSFKEHKMGEKKSEGGSGWIFEAAGVDGRWVGVVGV